MTADPSNGSTAAGSAPFAAARYRIGDVELAPMAPDLETIAEGLAAIDPWARVGRRPADFHAALTKPLAATFRFSIRLDGNCVGALVLRYPFLRGPYVELIGLFPQARGRGIARRVVEWMEHEVAAEATNLWLCVTDWNAPARAVYTALGFSEVGLLPELAADGTTEIFMRKAFASPLR